MILNSLIIENIRSYAHEEVEFPRGITLFEGDIGSGKSTILMAIEFALFGFGSQKPESLLAKKAESGYVILNFSVDGEKYEIKRALKRKSTRIEPDSKNTWIRVGDEKEPLSVSELKQRVLQILKFNEPENPNAESKIFRYAVYTPQETMKEVLSDKAKRLETIRKAFRIEDYSIAHSNAHEVLFEIRTKSAVLKEKFSDISQLESEISESEKSVTKLESEISQKQRQKGILEGEESEKIKELKELQAKNNERIKLELKKESLEEKIEAEKERILSIEQAFAEFEIELKENNIRLEELLEIEKPETEKSVTDLWSEIKKFREINDKSIKLETEKNSVSQDIARIKETLGKMVDSDKESTQNTLNGLQNEKESLEKFANEIKEKLEKVNDQKIQKETLKGTLEKQIAEFSKLGNACPTCKQDITENHHHTLVDEKKKD